MVMAEFSLEQEIQDNAYRFPYHYIPQWNGTEFSQVRMLSWGFEYIANLRFVTDQLKDIPFASMADVGCGDGRLLREIGKIYPDRELIGIDHSQRPIRLAQALNPSLSFVVMDVVNDSLSEQFDVVSATEVLEHIPPNHLPGFIEALGDLLKPDGTLLVTVPHKNRRRITKHYQHFNVSELNDLLNPHFEVVNIFPLHRRTKIFRLVRKIFLGADQFFVITNKKISTFFYRYYVRHFLYSPSEKECRSLGAVCRKKSSSSE